MVRRGLVITFALLVAFTVWPTNLAAASKSRTKSRIFGSRMGPGVKAIAKYNTGKKTGGSSQSKSSTSSASGPSSAKTTQVKPMPCMPASGSTQGGRPVASSSYQPTIDGCVLYLQPPARGRPQRPANRPSPQQVAAALFDRSRALAPSSDISIAPARVGLTGLTSYFWLENAPAPITAQAEAGPLTVTAQAGPSQYTWRFGDGGQMVTDHPGRPWTRNQPGDIPHVYERRGNYSVSVEVMWQAQWRINDGAWQPLGTFSTTSQTDYPVRQVVAMLARWR